VKKVVSLARRLRRAAGRGLAAAGFAVAFAAAFCAFSFLAGCSVAGKVRNAFGGQLPIQVTVAPHANEDTPVAVDLVVVYNQKLLDELMKLPAADWFARRAQFLKDYPDTRLVQNWEWVPGQQVEPFSIEYRAGARRVLLFADYVTDGDHRATVDPQTPFRLLLGERNFAVEALQ
jgi:type VI secretion system protein